MSHQTTAGPRPGLLLLPLAAALLLTGHSAGAQVAWEVTPRTALGLVYEDNPRLRASGAGDTDSATGLLLDADLRMRAYTERSEVLFRPRLRSSLYAGSKNSDLEDDDIFLNLSGNHQWQRVNAGLSSEWQRVSVRSSEFASATPDDPDDPPPTGDSGEFVRVDDYRTLWSLNPYVGWTISERNQVNVYAGYTDVSYRRSGLGSRGDYDYVSGGASFQHTLDQRNRFLVSVNASRFEADQAGSILENTSDSYGINFTYERSLSELWTGAITLGSTRTEALTLIAPAQQFCFDPNTFQFLPCPITEFKSKADNFVGNAELRRRGELTTVTATISRAISPNATGTEVVRDTIRLFVDRDFTQRLTASTGILIYDEESVGEFSTRDRRYYRLDGNVRYALTRHWHTRASYAYTRDKDDLRGGGLSRDRHRVFVGIEWRGLGWRNR